MKYVIAGNYKQAKGWARKNNVPFFDWFYIGDYHQILGAQDMDIVLVGTYWQAGKDLLETVQMFLWTGRIKSITRGEL